MKITIELVQQTIKNTLTEYIDENDIELKEEVGLDTPIYAAGNRFIDSIGLVTFLADLEDSISEIFNQEIIVADERAMSQRISPFRSVRSLSNYVFKLLTVEESE